MSELCAYRPCKCLIADDELFCSDVCAMLGAELVSRVNVSTAVPLKPDHEVVPRCPCGHDGCGDSLVSGQVN
jgi:hypothetical protein